MSKALTRKQAESIVNTVIRVKRDQFQHPVEAFPHEEMVRAIEGMEDEVGWEQKAADALDALCPRPQE